jgi:hypothetical protein
MQPLLKSKKGIAESYSFPTVILPLDLRVHHLKLEQQPIQHPYDKYFIFAFGISFFYSRRHFDEVKLIVYSS